MKAETCSLCVLLINYILCNKLVLDCKFIRFIHYFIKYICPSDFSGEKILSTPSYGGEVKPSVPCRALRHVKEPKSHVEVATFGKISRPFLAHSSAFRCWVR
jgi:hypothetical protein